MKSLAFATYWLMVFAVFSSVGSYNEPLTVESEMDAAAVSYSFIDVNCDIARRAGELAGVASVQCVK